MLSRLLKNLLPSKETLVRLSCSENSRVKSHRKSGHPLQDESNWMQTPSSPTSIFLPVFWVTDEDSLGHAPPIQPPHLKCLEAQPRAVLVWNSCLCTAGAKSLCLRGPSEHPSSPCPPVMCYLSSFFTAPHKPLQNNVFPSQSLKTQTTLLSSPSSPQPTLHIRSAGGQGGFSSSVLHSLGDSACVGGGCHWLVFFCICYF